MAVNLLAMKYTYVRAHSFLSRWLADTHDFQNLMVQFFKRANEFGTYLCFVCLFRVCIYLCGSLTDNFVDSRMNILRIEFERLRMVRRNRLIVWHHREKWVVDKLNIGNLVQIDRIDNLVNWRDVGWKFRRAKIPRINLKTVETMNKWYNNID